MKFIETKLSGAYLIEIEPVEDERGSFARTYCKREFRAQGLETFFPQHSISHSVRKGTLRGLHFQKDPYEEVKLVSCVQGAVLDVIVDMRPASATRWNWFAAELSARNNRRLYIPRGFAHGFMTMQSDSIVSYMISEFYTPSAASGLRFDDPVLAIDWPQPPTSISARDTAWPLLHVEPA
jgi:dTDP-4-dehydrorhamnose 3,5-epimerase